VLAPGDTEVDPGRGPPLLLLAMLFRPLHGSTIVQTPAPVINLTMAHPGWGRGGPGWGRRLPPPADGPHKPAARTSVRVAVDCKSRARLL
jgi:hypothetical protein